MMETNWELLEKEWQAKYTKLESDIEMHRLSFLLTKKCKCKGQDCRHYQKERDVIFDKRINHLLASRININASAVAYTLNLD